MNDSPKVSVETPIGEMKLHRDLGYIELTVHPKKNDSVEEMQLHNEMTMDLFQRYGYTKLPALVDVRPIKGVTKEVRDYASDYEKKHSKTTKLALVVSSGLSKIGGNLFLKFSKLSYPIRLFTDKNKALKWLLDTTD